MTATFDEVLKAIPTLSPSELECVVKGCKAALGMRGGSTGTVPDVTPASTSPVAVELEQFEDLVLQVIVDTLNSVGGIPTGIKLLQASPAHAPFTAKLPAVRRYIKRAQIVNRVQQRAVLSIGLSLLHDHLTQNKIPAGPRGMLVNIDKVPEMLDRAFPGYAQSGMLGWICRPASMETKKVQKDVR